MNNPHDRLFREALASVENACGEPKSVLPDKVVRRVDWSTLRLRPGSFIDEELSERQTNLLFSVRMIGGARGTGDAEDAEDAGGAAGSEVLIYVLVEHQSSSDALMPYRMLRYLVRIWDRYLENRYVQQGKKDRDHGGRVHKENIRAKRLPAIIPVVVHHGERAWAAPKRFSELMDLEEEPLCEIADRLPDFEFVLDDLPRCQDSCRCRRPVVVLGDGLSSWTTGCQTQLAAHCGL